MANPTGKTHHYGEHDPIAEPGGMHVVYKDEPRGVGPPEMHGSDGRRHSPRRLDESSYYGARTTGAVADLVERHPVMSLLAAAGCGLLVAAVCAPRRDD